MEIPRRHHDWYRAVESLTAKFSTKRVEPCLTNHAGQKINPQMEKAKGTKVRLC